MLVIVLGIVNLGNLLHPEKALLPMLVMLAEIVTLVRVAQLANAPEILFISPRIVRFVTGLSSKARLAMPVTSSPLTNGGIITFPIGMRMVAMVRVAPFVV